VAPNEEQEARALPLAQFTDETRDAEREQYESKYEKSQDQPEESAGKAILEQNLDNPETASGSNLCRGGSDGRVNLADGAAAGRVGSVYRDADSKDGGAGKPVSRPVENPVIDPTKLDGHFSGQVDGQKSGIWNGHLTGSPLETEFTDSNTRQIPGHRPVENPLVNPSKLDGLDTPELPGLNFNELDQSTGWDELWRLEKDGNNYRWRLRFTPERVSRGAGKVGADIRRRLGQRPGKGRHQASRQDAERLKWRAEFTAVGLRTMPKRRIVGQNDTSTDAGRNPGTHNPDIKHEQVSDVSGMAQWEDMPDLPIM
jgi:hypothetical protein